MRVAEFTRDLASAPSSEDEVVVNVDGTVYRIGQIEFTDGLVTLVPGDGPPTTVPVALAERTAEDQAVFGGEDTIPGHADVMHEIATGEGIASDLRDGEVKTEPEKSDAWSDRGQEYHSGPEQPSAPVLDEQVADDPEG